MIAHLVGVLELVCREKILYVALGVLEKMIEKIK